MSQNTTHAVMSQRSRDLDGFDDFPTPPWAVRALLNLSIPSVYIRNSMSCLEPAANRGYMACALKEFFADVHSSDIMDYGYCEVKDFLKNTYENNSFDWVITNPPFRLAGEFINEAIKVSRVGVAMLVRTVFVEGIKRYNNLYSFNPPFRVAQFSERVPMIKGRVNKNATTATSYCWMIWVKNGSKNTELFWIPPCRKKLEKASDYQLPMERKNGTDNSD